jgi:hypothetical protein
MTGTVPASIGLVSGFRRAYLNDNDLDGFRALGTRIADGV